MASAREDSFGVGKRAAEGRNTKLRNRNSEEREEVGQRRDAEVAEDRGEDEEDEIRNDKGAGIKASGTRGRLVSSGGCGRI